MSQFVNFAIAILQDKIVQDDFFSAADIAISGTLEVQICLKGEKCG